MCLNVGLAVLKLYHPDDLLRSLIYMLADGDRPLPGHKRIRMAGAQSSGRIIHEAGAERGRERSRSGVVALKSTGLRGEGGRSRKVFTAS